MLDANNQESDESLVGVGGFLLLYVGASVIAVMILVIEIFLPLYFGKAISGIHVPRLLVECLGLYLIFEYRHPVTRYFHIILAAAIVAEASVYVLQNATAGGIGALTGASVWLLYWIRSRRVKLTYCASMETKGSSPAGA